MKNNFFVALSIFTLMYIGSNSVAGQDLRARATEVLNKANRLNQQLVGFKHQQDIAKTGILGITESNIRTGVSETPQIAEINQKLEELKSKQGVDQCRKTRNDGITKIVSELAPSYRSTVNERIDAQIEATNTALESIAAITKNLQGNLLETAINNCESGTELCAITNTYPQQITEFTNTMNSNRQKLYTGIENVYKQQIKSQIPAKVINEVYNPTSSCIKNIDNTGGSTKESSNDSS